MCSSDLLQRPNADTLFADWMKWKLVANLPYSVASPILVELALHPRGPERMVVTLQLEVARRIKLEELASANAQVAATRADLDKVNRQVAQIEADVQTELPRLRARLIEVYKLGRARYVRMLFSSGSLADARQAFRLVTAMAQHDQQRMAAHRARIDALTAARQEIQARARTLATEQADAERAAAAAERAVAARDQQIGRAHV